MANKQQKLELKFDPSTIEDLGVKMYSQLPQALAELVANAYDADAGSVEIKLYDADPNNKRIVVRDDGIGMSFDDVNGKFLRIGRKRRLEDGDSRKTKKGRAITGRKGLGKLALFGIGKNITIETSKAGEATGTKFELKWDEIVGGGKPIYEPATTRPEKVDSNEQGTTITLSELSRASAFNLDEIAVSLSKMFDCLDENFRVILQKNDSETKIELTRDLRYAGMDHEFSWDVEDVVRKISGDYPNKSKLKGKIVSSPAGKTMPHYLRGITLYVNGRLANAPGFFGLGETPHAFSYLSGWIDADFLDESDVDLIATDRQSVRWDLPEPAALQSFLQKIVRWVENAWLEGRRENKKKANTKKAGVDLEKWYGTLPNAKMKEDLEQIVNKVSDNPNIEAEDYAGVVKKLHEIIPDYPYYHWRELHRDIQDASEKLYQDDKDYYAAFCEAMKRYKNAVKDKSGVPATEDLDIVSGSFGAKDKPLITTAKYKKRPNGKDFSSKTLENIEDGQLALSRGVVQGGRNVVSHEEHSDLKTTGLFTEKDCLDLLSLLSHLFKRLDESQKKP